MTKINLFAFCLAGLIAVPVSKADAPDCETLLVQQPSPMITDLTIVYTWDSTCEVSPETVIALRDGEEVDVAFHKSKKDSLIRYEGTLRGTTSGMHRIGVAVILDDGDSYDLVDRVLVSGTAAKGAESSTPEDSASGGCSLTGARPGTTALVGLLAVLGAFFLG